MPNAQAGVQQPSRSSAASEYISSLRRSHHRYKLNADEHLGPTESRAEQMFASPSSVKAELGTPRPVYAEGGDGASPVPVGDVLHTDPAPLTPPGTLRMSELESASTVDAVRSDTVIRETKQMLAREALRSVPLPRMASLEDIEPHHPPMETNAEQPSFDDDEHLQDRATLLKCLRVSNLNLQQSHGELLASIEAFEEYQKRMRLYEEQVAIEQKAHEQRETALREELSVLRRLLSVDHETVEVLAEADSAASNDAIALVQDVFASLPALNSHGSVAVAQLLAALKENKQVRELYSKGHLQSLFGDIVFASQDDVIVWHDLHQRLRRGNQASLPQDQPAEGSLPMDRWRQQTEELGEAVSSVRHQWRCLRSEVQRMCSRVRRDLDKAPAAIASRLRGAHRHLQARLEEEKSALRGVQANYRKEANWRRLLHNELMSLKGNIRVICRIRPMLTREKEEDRLIHSDLQSPTVLALVNPRSGTRTLHEYDRVLGPKASQEETFRPSQDLVLSVLDGFNVSLFVYGQTGSGKTFTMSGPEHQRGLAFRAIQSLFETMEQRQQTHQYCVRLSVIELYDKHMYDLLADPSATDHCKLSLGRHKNGGVKILGALEVDVKSWKAAKQGLGHAMKYRNTKGTSVNDRSSRSHCIVRVRVLGSNRVSGCRYKSCLHLVELAGSETLSGCGRSEQERHHIRETLSSLGGVFYALGAKHSHVPYQGSKLTYLLSDYLGGDAKSMFYVCLNPCTSQLSETLDSLKFAGRVRQIRQPVAQPHSEMKVPASASKSMSAIQPTPGC